MMAALSRWWTGLSARERVLVGIAAALAAAVLLWLLIRALVGGMEARAEAHREAIARAARVEAKAALLAAAPAPTAASAQAGPLDQWLAQSAADTGLTLDRNDARGERLASIAIASARAPALVGWLAGLEAQGVIVDRLSINPGTDGSVALTAELRRP
jgi:general secretion pathway protein M